MKHPGFSLCPNEDVDFAKGKKIVIEQSNLSTKLSATEFRLKQVLSGDSILCSRPLAVEQSSTGSKAICISNCLQEMFFFFSFLSIEGQRGNEGTE